MLGFGGKSRTGLSIRGGSPEMTRASSADISRHESGMRHLRSYAAKLAHPGSGRVGSGRTPEVEASASSVQ